MEKNCKLIVMILALSLQGCKTVSNEGDGANYHEIPITQGFMSKESFLHLGKLHYPQNKAIKGKEGCTTIEYVVSKENRILDAYAIASSHRDFSKVSKQAIKHWSWERLPKDHLSTTIKARNTFYFCIDDSQTIKQCPIETFDDICPRSDRIDIIASCVRR